MEYPQKMMLETDPTGRWPTTLAPVAVNSEESPIRQSIRGVANVRAPKKPNHDDCRVAPSPGGRFSPPVPDPPQ